MNIPRYRLHDIEVGLNDGREKGEGERRGREGDGSEVEGEGRVGGEPGKRPGL